MLDLRSSHTNQDSVVGLRDRHTDKWLKLSFVARGSGQRDPGSQSTREITDRRELEENIP